MVNPSTDKPEETQRNVSLCSFRIHSGHSRSPSPKSSMSGFGASRKGICGSLLCPWNISSFEFHPHWIPLPVTISIMTSRNILGEKLLATRNVSAPGDLGAGIAKVYPRIHPTKHQRNYANG